MRKVMAPEAPFPMPPLSPFSLLCHLHPVLLGSFSLFLLQPGANTQACPYSGISAPGPKVPSLHPPPCGAALDGLIPLCVTQS